MIVCHYVTWAPKIDLDNKFTLDGKTRAYGPPRSFEGSQCVLYRNVDGKQKPRIMRYSGGHPAYREHCDAVAAGGYRTLSLV